MIAAGFPIGAPSPAHAYAELLQGKKIKRGAQMVLARYHLAIASIGAGPDHFAGETPVAFSDEDLNESKFEYGAIFTDRRMIARAGEDVLDVPYPYLQDARALSGVIIDDLVITAWGREFKLSGLADVKAIAAFLVAMARLHPAQRLPPPRPLVHPPEPGDPTGGRAARAGIWSGDVRVLPLLGMAIEGHDKGWFSAEVGADLVARAMLFDRTLLYGRGSREGWMTSSLGAADLAYAFARMLGAPKRVWDEGHARVFDFTLSTGSNVAGAAASTAVGLVALGVLGVGWVSTPGRSSFDVRVKIAPGQASTGFALYEGNKPLGRESAAMAASLLETLPRIEGRLLLQRAAFGWELSPEQLDDLRMEEIYRRVAEAIGPLDVGIYFPKR